MGLGCLGMSFEVKGSDTSFPRESNNFENQPRFKIDYLQYIPKQEVTKKQYPQMYSSPEFAKRRFQFIPFPSISFPPVSFPLPSNQLPESNNRINLHLKHRSVRVNTGYFCS